MVLRNSLEEYQGYLPTKTHLCLIDKSGFLLNEVVPVGQMKERRRFANEEIEKGKTMLVGDFASLGRSPSSFLNFFIS